MRRWFKIKTKALRIGLRIAGLTGVIFLMESCYGVPTNVYLTKEDYHQSTIFKDTTYVDVSVYSDKITDSD